jgi:hypothetical protein
LESQPATDRHASIHAHVDNRVTVVEVSCPNSHDPRGVCYSCRLPENMHICRRPERPDGFQRASLPLAAPQLFPILGRASELAHSAPKDARVKP